MEFSVELRPSQLRVLSVMLTNVAAGLLFLLLTTRDVFVLTTIIFFVILCVGLSVKIEDILNNL